MQGVLGKLIPHLHGGRNSRPYDSRYNQVISDVCRDSLETYTHNTKFT